MNRYCYNAETTDINEWLTAAHKLRNLIDEGTRGAVGVHEESWYIQKKAHCHLIGTPSNPVAGVIWHPVRMTQKQGCYA